MRIKKTYIKFDELLHISQTQIYHLQYTKSTIYRPVQLHNISHQQPDHLPKRMTTVKIFGIIRIHFPPSY